MTNAPPNIEAYQQYVNWFMDLGPELYSIAVFIVFGYVLKLVPGYSTKFIPITVILSASAYYSFMCGNDMAPHWVREPLPWKLGTGLVVGFASWMLHHHILRKWVDPILTKDKPKMDFPDNAS